jgi:hypothetical protein
MLVSVRRRVLKRCDSEECSSVLRLIITGTLDPVQGLTGLTDLNLYSNKIGGMSDCLLVFIYLPFCI